VPLDAGVAELEPGAPDMIPAQQGEGEAEVEGAVPGAPAVVPMQQGVDSPAGVNEEVCSVCPSPYLHHFQY
jgi:hypothetical protein